MTPLFVLGDPLQAALTELGDCDGDYPCVLKLRRGAVITADVVRELNDRFGNATVATPDDARGLRSPPGQLVT